MTEQPKWVGRGRQIISAVILEHGLHPDDFFGYSRFTHLVVARRDAASRLIAAGFSTTQAGRIMKRNSTTIVNYASPVTRQNKRESYATKRLLGHVADDVREVVLAAAKAEGVTPYRLMADWIIERADWLSKTKAREAA